MRPKLNLKLCGFTIKHLEVEGHSIALLKSPYSSLIIPLYRPSATFHQLLESILDNNLLSSS